MPAPFSDGKTAACHDRLGTIDRKWHLFVCRALPGYNYMRDFTPAVVIAPYGSGAWGAADLCASLSSNRMGV